jgi:hypothetical protein
MPICENFRKTVVCQCGHPVGPQCEVVGNTVLACQEKASIWVRVRNHLGVSLHALKVSGSDLSGKTGKTGFATFDDVPPKTYAVAVSKSWFKLSPANAANHFKTAGVGSEEGWIRVYEEIDRPTPAPVV